MSQIAVEPPSISVDVVTHEVTAQFGLSGTFAPLVSEYDQNFCMTTADGPRYVVKIVGTIEAPASTDFQIAALLHLEAAGLVHVPRIVRTVSGELCAYIECDGVTHRLRIVTYLDGALLQHSGANPQLARDFGRRLAELDLALNDFSHAGEDRPLIWDMQKAADLRALLVHISDAPLREQVDSVLQTLESQVLPLFAGLRHQVIHNDANPENILVDRSGAVSGIIDFTDMIRAPLVVDVAVAAAYLRSDSADPAQLIAPFVRGYHEISPIEDREIDLLFDLVRTRLAMTISMLYWRLSVRAADDPYRQRTLQGEGGATRFLQALNSLGKDGFLERVTQELALS
jgi:Ser/Thr protein kinase RdoA (MazF antagonist)